MALPEQPTQEPARTAAANRRRRARVSATSCAASGRCPGGARSAICMAARRSVVFTAAPLNQFANAPSPSPLLRQLPQRKKNLGRDSLPGEVEQQSIDPHPRSRGRIHRSAVPADAQSRDLPLDGQDAPRPPVHGPRGDSSSAARRTSGAAAPFRVRNSRGVRIPSP